MSKLREKLASMGIEIKVVDGDPEHDEETLAIVNGLNQLSERHRLYDAQSDDFKSKCGRSHFVLGHRFNPIRGRSKFPK